MPIDEEELNTGVEDIDDEELDDKPEPPPVVPEDRNEPIEVVTDEARKESRKQRRAERQNEFRRVQEESARLRAEVEQLRRQPQYQQPAPQQQVSPAVQRLQDIDAARRRLNKEYEAVAGSRRLSEQEQAWYEQQAESLNTAKIAAVQEARQPQINEQEIYRRVAWQQFTAEHADVWNDEKAQNWAIGEWQKQVRGEGKADTKQLAEEILDRARVRFGMKPRNGGGSAPTQADKQRLAGVGSRGAPGAPQRAGVIQLSAQDKRMARIAFGDKMSEAEAYQKFANTVGKKRQEMEGGGKRR